MKRRKMLIFVFIFFTINLFCENNVFFEQANEFYNKGEYQKAVEFYNKIQPKSVNVYYNLGNAYFKLDKKGVAFYNYKLALRIKGQDKKIESTINFLRKIRKDQFKVNKNGLTVFIEKLQNLYTLKSGTIILTILFFLFFILLSFYLFYRKRLVLYVLIIIVTILVVFSFFYYNKFNSLDEGVIVKNDTHLLSEPSNESGDLIAVLNEMTEVKINQYEGDWIEVIVADSNKGWLKTDSTMILKK